jgi:molybdopterin molybdotransferase
MAREARKADWVSVAEALEIILGSVVPLPPERRPLLEALGAALAEEVRATLDLPPWDNSAMDGFAARAADVEGASEAAPRELRVVDDVPAGSFPSRALGAGEACRVMTGAPVPEGADSVIRVEHTDGGSEIGMPGGRVRVLSDADAGRNIRRRGEDLRQDDVVLRVGTRLRAAEIGVAASVGRSRLTVVRRPRVAILASGDELVDLDGFAEVSAGRRIISSNSYSLAAQLREAGLEVRDLGIAPDEPRSIRRHLEAARGCDALITSAGISVGEHDHMHTVLEELGVEVAFWRVKMRPGSPFAFGRVTGLGGIPWFGLPGNPVSSMVTCEVFARPALLRMAGHTAVFPPVTRVRLRGDYPAPSGLTHFPRARLHREPDGAVVATLTGAQGSGILTSMAAADALLIVPETRAGAADGDRLTALLLGGQPLQPEPGWNVE